METKGQVPLAFPYHTTRLAVDRPNDFVLDSTFASSICNAKGSRTFLETSKEAIMEDNDDSMLLDDERDDETEQDVRLMMHWNVGGVFRRAIVEQEDDEEEDQERDDTHMMFTIKRATPVISHDDQRDACEQEELYKDSIKIVDEHRAWEDAAYFLSDHPMRESRMSWIVEPLEERRHGF